MEPATSAVLIGVLLGVVISLVVVIVGLYRLDRTRDRQRDRETAAMVQRSIDLAHASLANSPIKILAELVDSATETLQDIARNSSDKALGFSDHELKRLSIQESIETARAELEIARSRVFSVVAGKQDAGPAVEPKPPDDVIRAAYKEPPSNVE